MRLKSVSQNLPRDRSWAHPYIATSRESNCDGAICAGINLLFHALSVSILDLSKANDMDDRIVATFAVQSARINTAATASFHRQKLPNLLI